MSRSESPRPPYVSAGVLFGGIGLAFWGVSDFMELWDEKIPDGFMDSLDEKYHAFKLAHPEIQPRDVGDAFWAAHPQEYTTMQSVVKGNELRTLGDVALGAVGSVSALFGAIFFVRNGVRYLTHKKA